MEIKDFLQEQLKINFKKARVCEPFLFNFLWYSGCRSVLERVVDFTHPPLKYFFLELLEGSRRKQKMAPDLEVDSYLAEMLMRYVNPTPVTMEYLEKPLLLEAYQAPSEGIIKLQMVSETLLFLLGCYTERLSRSGIDLSSFVASAKGGYALISQHVHHDHPYVPGYCMCAVYLERAAAMLNDMSDEWIRREEKNLLRIIERYAVFQSKRDLDILLTHNVAFMEGSKTIVFNN